jgi:hypothetical protein
LASEEIYMKKNESSNQKIGFLKVNLPPVPFGSS